MRYVDMGILSLSLISKCVFIFALGHLGAGAAEMNERHLDGASQLADEQDELSADVQQLVIEQTMTEVIELLSEVEAIMDEATDQLTEANTGVETIAAQTEIIEKIHAAAKARQKGSGQGESGSAMMDMMERMMGMKPGAEQDKKNGQGASGGQGQTGDSDIVPDNIADGAADQDRKEERRVPKAAGDAGRNLPAEFQEALDAYNRGLTEQELR